MVKGPSQEGIALLLVLWVLTILMVIVLSFSFTTRTESHATLSFKENIEKRFLAEAGIERGIMEVFYRNQFKNQQVILEGKEVWKVDGTPHEGQAGDGRYTVMIIDDSGKIGLNNLNDGSVIILKNLLKSLGVEEKDAETIGDSILDWKDPDDMHRLNGAEDDYYEPLGYEAKDANFDTLEELLMVKGMTPEILYGDDDGKGLIDFLSLKSQSGQINVNAAPREVLMAVPGMTLEAAEGIVSFRQTKEIQNIATEGGIPPESRRFFSVVGYGPYTIESIGYKTEEKKGYAIRATVTVQGNNKFRYLYYKSPAKVAHSEEKTTSE